jgi:hypothetical protein
VLATITHFHPVLYLWARLGAYPKSGVPSREWGNIGRGCM